MHTVRVTVNIILVGLVSFPLFKVLFPVGVLENVGIIWLLVRLLLYILAVVVTALIVATVSNTIVSTVSSLFFKTG